MSFGQFLTSISPILHSLNILMLAVWVLHLDLKTNKWRRELDKLVLARLQNNALVDGDDVTDPDPFASVTGKNPVQEGAHPCK